MKVYVIPILLTLLTSLAHADIETDYPEVSNTILELGIDLDDFSTIWPLYCNPKWSKTMPIKLSKEVKFTRQAINYKFFSSEIIGANVKLSSGETCQALLAYYLSDKDSKIIRTFIEKDRGIREKYGFSSIDLFKYPGNFQGNFTTYSQPPGQKELILKLIERFTKENIFVVEETIKSTGYVKVNGKMVEINVAPYSTFHLEPTAEYVSAHKRLEK